MFSSCSWTLKQSLRSLTLKFPLVPGAIHLLIPKLTQKRGFSLQTLARTRQKAALESAKKIELSLELAKKIG